MKPEDITILELIHKNQKLEAEIEALKQKPLPEYYVPQRMGLAGRWEWFCEKKESLDVGIKIAEEHKSSTGYKTRVISENEPTVHWRSET